MDAGYDAPRIAHLLGDLPVQVLGRLRSDRGMRRPAPSRVEFAAANPAGGRSPKHGGEFVLGDPATWGVERVVAWLEHDGPLPVIEGHRDPAGAREAAQRWGEPASLALVVAHRCRTRRTSTAAGSRVLDVVLTRRSTTRRGRLRPW
ncbi:transposase [Streptomyces sp. enrichment culture]|uniref:transposase n=1 Tax=Streptomyces sp. enrichment culture TaxID=1795815 RepID=UPI003F57644B